MTFADKVRREFSFITGNYRVLIISWIIMDFAMEMPSPNFQYYVQALGGTGIALGIIGFANFLGLAVVAFPGGYLADKYGRRQLITTMTFGMAASFLFFAFATSWHFILIGTIINSLCLIYQPALFAIIQDSLPTERRGMGESITQLIHGAFNTPGPVVAGFLLLEFGLVTSMRIIYLFMTVLFLIAAVWRLRLTETMSNREPIRLRYFVSSYPKAVFQES
jgi:MFS family permease